MEETGGEDDLKLVHAALQRQQAACRQIVLRVMPIVHHRVIRVWAVFSRRRGHQSERDEVMDLTQQVLLLLFDNGGRVLNAWDPNRGLSLDNFVGLVAEREASAVLRSGRRSAWAETPTSDDILELVHFGPELEREISSRDELTQIWRALESRLSPNGLALLRALMIEELPIEHLARQFGMSAGALYTFRSRARATMQEIRERLNGGEGTPAQAAGSGIRSCAREPTSLAPSANRSKDRST